MSIESWLSREIIRISKINDKEEKQKQSALLMGIIEKKNEYEDYLWSYKRFLIEQDIKNRGIILEKKDGLSKSIRKQWETEFAAGVTKEDKESIFINQYLWHIFSYEVQNALVKSKARQAFNRKRKNHVYIFYQNLEDVFYVEKGELLKASDFDMEDDVYIVDSEMKWTYVHTHELQCGPYFMQNKNI